ncbi:amino acid adenylation domain-containing protein [Kitasatospora aureofaciens]|uniref:amino acid adenylation domain-containing protein n=1 Tax=Kitasatospora aureofaciens TaxID=1894 RepID=UPI0037CC690E
MTMDKDPSVESAHTGSYAFGDRIDSVVAHWAVRQPHAVAVRQGTRTLTYAELHDTASAVARALRARRVRAGSYVPVLIEPSPELVIALLGVLMAGGAYVVVDAAWPAGRINDVIEQSGSSLVIGDGNRPSPVRSWPQEHLQALMADGASIGGTGTGPVEGPTDGTQAACVFFTSGSTGRPKGVIAPHRGIVRALVGNPALPADPHTTFLQVAPLAWDAFAMELWSPLLNGGCSVLRDAGSGLIDVESFRALVRGGVNSALLTSALFAVFTEEDPSVFEGLEVLVVGGDRVPAAAVRRVLRRYPRLRCVNAYGPAEGSILATAHVVRQDDVSGDETEIPIGRAIPQTGVVLVDEDGAPVPAGTVGELLVSGDGVAIGYLGNQHETEARFFTVAQDGVLPTGRYYRSGDLAVADGQGLLWYRGRVDRQFKRHGVRIEPGEIEAVVETHPSVASSAVLLIESASGHRRLACAYTTTDGKPVDPVTLREHAAARLVEVMVPDDFQHMQSLPLGPTRKVDSERLREMFDRSLPQPSQAVPAVPAAGPLSPALLAEISDLLGKPGLSAHEDLPAAGLASLDAVRLAARLSRLLQAQVSVADVYERRSLAAVCAAAAPAQEGPAADARPLRPRDDRPLSHAQQRFLVSERFSPGDADNLVVQAYLLNGPLDAAALKRAVRRVVARHEALRTVYPWRVDLPVQHVVEPGLADLRWEDVASPQGITSSVAEIAEGITSDWWEGPHPDLGEQLPIQARLCRLDERRHLLCLRIHHIAFDGRSEQVFIQDLQTSYRHERTAAPEQSEPAHGYSGYGAWESDRLQDWLSADLPHWEAALRRPPAAFLPAPESDTEATCRELVRPLSAQVVQRLTVAAGRNGGPPVSGLIAAAGLAMARTFSVPELCVGTLTDGRTDPALDGVVGYFVNPLAIPLRSLLDGTPSELLGSAAAACTAGLRHARTPFDELVRKLRPDRSRHPWFQAWVILQSSPPQGRLSDGTVLESVRIRPPRTRREWTLQAFPHPDGHWELVSQWRDDVLGADTARRLLAGIVEAAEELAERG